MKKTILLLINGFGVERKDSDAVYSHDLMPNFDNITKTALFGAIATAGSDYETGYSYFSIPQTGENNKFLDDMVYDESLAKNEVLLKIKQDVVGDKKLHIFLCAEDASMLNQLKAMLQVINDKHDKKIYVHIIMTSSDLESYNEIDSLLSKLAFENNELTKIGIVVGSSNVNNDNMLRMVLREQGERWLQFSKKIDILHRDIVSPESAQPFFVHEGFAFSEGDSLLLLNYTNADMVKFLKNIESLKFNLYSLFPYQEGIKNMFKKEKASNYLASFLEKYGIKAMVFSDNEHINTINYYLNGSELKTSENITFAINDEMLFSNKEAVIDLVDNKTKDINGYIIDYDIGKFKNMAEIKDTLHKIDATIKNIYDASSEKGYTFIISSLYGIHTTIRDGVLDRVVNFSGRVPCVFISPGFSPAEYSIAGTDTTGLMLTFLTNINEEVQMNRLVHKKTSLEKLLKTKK